MLLTQCWRKKNLSHLQKIAEEQGKIKKALQTRNAFFEFFGWDGPVLKPRFPDSQQNQPSDLTRADRRDILRAAVFLWKTPLVTPRISSG